MTIAKTKQQRLVQTLAESHKDKTMTRKVDTYEYESLETCIQTEQVLLALTFDK